MKRIGAVLARALLPCALGLTSSVTAAGAQESAGMKFWAVATGTMTRERLTFESSSATLTGQLIGLEGGAAFGRLVLRGGYQQGAISPSGPGNWQHDVAESFASVGVLLFEAFELAAGVQGRVYVTKPVSERWLVWQLRARWEAPLLDTRARAWTEVWGSAGGNVNTVDVFRGVSQTPGYLVRGDGLAVDRSFKGSRGGSVGMSFRFAPRSPVVRLGYTITESRLALGGYRDTMEGLTLSIGFERR